MKQKLVLYAVISTPIFSLYAVSHPLLFGILPFEVLLVPLLGININVLITWLINIYLTLNFSHLSIWRRILLSYSSIICIQLFLSVLRYFFANGRNFIPKQATSLLENNLMYPALTSAVINVIIIIICQATEASYRRNKAELKAKELALQNSEAQKKLLAQQLQPHFLFNALSVLKSLISESPTQAEEYTVKLADFLRYSVQSRQNEVVTLTDELRFVEDFIELQKVRFEDSFEYNVQISEAILHKKIPIFALQTLIENAFKHNHFTRQKPLNINVTGKENEIAVWNNKMETKPVERTKTGLNNLHQRYELITGKGIEITETSDFFEVTIPLI